MKKNQGHTVNVKKMKKFKFKRRRAIECKLLKKSDTHNGYLKYLVTIQEKDGRVHSEPAYGKDMQDALSRLLNTERTVVVENKINSNPWLALIAWAGLCIWPAQKATETGDPIWLTIILAGLGLTIGSIIWWYNYINRGQ